MIFLIDFSPEILQNQIASIRDGLQEVSDFKKLTLECHKWAILTRVA